MLKITFSIMVMVVAGLSLYFEYMAFWSIGPRFFNPNQLYYLGWFLVMCQICAALNKILAAWE